MSIREALKARLEEKALHLWMPQLPGSHSRVIYLSADLFSQVTEGMEQDERIGRLWRDFDSFSQGGLVRVGRGREVRCNWKQLDPAGNEVWTLRSRDEKPQMRVFGRFIAPDEFVATHALTRSFLGDILDNPAINMWRREIIRCTRTWDLLFQSYPPHSGVLINDYVTSNAIEVGDLP